jgi:2-keto-4-pentenoate hydratase/2-oxohepta-3-ene-1,7-dioic acid hydratase in catechol pathway
MRLATVRLGRRDLAVAAGRDGTVHELIADRGRASVARALATGLEGVALGPQIDPRRMRWLPPVPSPARILCAGFNFRGHASESARAVPEHPTFFVRFPSSCVGHRERIVCPAASATLDWEGEVAVVIGRGGRRIPVERALEHVGGYTAFADNSVRAFQEHSTQATAGKNFDRSGSFGPWVVTADEVGDPAALEVRTLLDGEEVQHGRLADLIFGVPELVSYASTFTTLAPGDVIATGTPAGIGLRRTPPVFLRAGNELAVEIPGLMRLENRVADEPGPARGTRRQVSRPPSTSSVSPVM